MIRAVSPGNIFCIGERCVNKVFDKHLSNIFGILKTCKIPRCLYCSSLQQAANGNQVCIELITKTEKCNGYIFSFVFKKYVYIFFKNKTECRAHINITAKGWYILGQYISLTKAAFFRARVIPGIARLARNERRSVFVHSKERGLGRSF